MKGLLGNVRVPTPGVSSLDVERLVTEKVLVIQKDVMQVEQLCASLVLEQRRKWERNVLMIKFLSSNLSLLIVIRALENWSRPFSNQLLGHSFDTKFWLLALCIEEDHLTDTATEQSFLLNW